MTLSLHHAVPAGDTRQCTAPKRLAAAARCIGALAALGAILRASMPLAATRANGGKAGRSNT